MNLYLRSQADIVTDIQAFMRDTAVSRWTEAEIVRALNMALSTWHGRVEAPFIYTITGGFQAGTYSYSLPAYVREPLQPQYYQTAPTYFDFQVDDDASYTWTDVPSWDVEPDGSGGLTLRLGGMPMSLDGRVIWWASNGNVPATAPTVNTGIDDDDTSVIVDTTEDIADTGYVKINSEWLSYAGITRGSATTTLSNLSRALNGTTAASHSGSDTVYWGVGVDDGSLWRQLYDQIFSYLHEMFLTNASAQERDHHERQVSFYQARADNALRHYASMRPIPMVLSRKIMGV